ncbi:hypothetical protein DID88_004533 [Monilinia fructigena]|uniref:Uncharacterized protein n=1 Tax=Monilinia fructigena TaxID=38457 RepID=A0A395IQW0_9HELO|nr:hypothetical protein DID88_004533 [Monilinia fructigena]
MLTLLSSNYVPQPTSHGDLAIASIAFGWTLGFGWLTTWTAYKQTKRVRERYGITRVHTPYVVMIWSEIIVCLSFAIICWLHLFGSIPPSFAFFFCILTLWALQVQFLLQIIVNRISILFTTKRKAMHLKITVATLIKFNALLVAFSLSMDVLIIGMMSLKNSFVYMQFHPLAYLVKLNIEMSMAELIAKVSVLPSNYLPPKHRIPLQIGIQTDISIKHDDVSLKWTHWNWKNRIGIVIRRLKLAKNLIMGDRLYFVGEDYENTRAMRSEIDPRVKGGGWSNA